MKILLCDDSIIMRTILKEVLKPEGFEVAGEAGNGEKGVELNNKIDADAIIMDINMPIMNGLEATKRIMEEKPVPILIFSNAVDTTNSFEALQYGAVEVLRKPDIDALNDPDYKKKFIATIKTVAESKPEPRQRRKPVAVAAPEKNKGTKEGSRTKSGGESGRKGPPRRTGNFEAVVIGASTGGPIAVKELLTRLPADFPLGIALVQHIEARFDRGYAEWLDGECALTVEIAAEEDRFEPGHVKVAPGNRHLVCRGKRLYHDDSPKYDNQKPSVNKLFDTSSECYGDRLLAVLLTGMGSDGGKGCVKIKNAGGYTVVQNSETSLIYGMPKAAVDSGGASAVLGLDEMASYILQLVGYNG